MGLKNIKIDSEVHEKLIKQSKRMNIKIGEFAELCLIYFIDENVDPRKPAGMKEIRDTFIQFIRTQEKLYHLPAKEFNARLEKEIDAINHNVLSVKAILNDKQRGK